MKINVGFLVAYDYELLKFSIPCIYNSADKVVLALDENLNTWSGNKFKVDDSFFDWIKGFDVDNKIEIYTDDFYVKENTAMQNEVRERKMLASKMGQGLCLQLDADEFMLDFDGVVRYLRKKQKRLTSNKPVQVCVYWTNVFKKLEDGYLLVDAVSPVIIGTNRPNYVKGRKNKKQQKLIVPFQMIHQTWGRSREELKFKIDNWGHNKDFDGDKFLDFWDSVNKENHKDFDQGFHPFNKKLWRNLVYVEGKDVEEVIRGGKFPNLISKWKMHFKNTEQRIKFLFK